MTSRKESNGVVKSRAKTGSAGRDLPLPTLLSRALVAFTIELDNEFEHRSPHRTTNSGVGWGPWLASVAMYLNCMQFVTDEGVTVEELERLARTPTNLHGMQRWGYIFIEPDADSRSSRRPVGHFRPVGRPGRDWVIRPTFKGKMARELWRPLFGEIEERWQGRFGKDEIGRLREALAAVPSGIDAELPDCLPILGYGLISKGRESSGEKRRSTDDGSQNRGPGHPDPAELTLATLLARVLLAFAIDFESESPLSLAICANVLRVLDEKGVPVRELPRLSGVSKEAIAMATGFLGKKGLIVLEDDPMGSRAKMARLTVQGVEAEGRYRRLLAKTEERWRERFGEEKIRALREALGRLEAELFRGLEPYPEGWRASVRKPEVLPHYPMVLHRGGYPDGS